MSILGRINGLKRQGLVIGISWFIIEMWLEKVGKKEVIGIRWGGQRGGRGLEYLGFRNIQNLIRYCQNIYKSGRYISDFIRQ